MTSEVEPAYNLIRALQHESWVDSANCRGSDPGIFFSNNWKDRIKAFSLCDNCSVVDDCLEFATENRIDVGIWGGSHPGERSTGKKRRPRQQNISTIGVPDECRHGHDLRNLRNVGIVQGRWRCLACHREAVRKHNERKRKVRMKEAT